MTYLSGFRGPLCDRPSDVAKTLGKREGRAYTHSRESALEWRRFWKLPNVPKFQFDER
jgi:hypothetical protein